MPFIENFSFRIVWIGAITLIFAVLCVLLFSLNTKVENHSALVQLALMATTLKQELVNLKLQESTLTPEGRESYQIGLLAELKGDSEFAQQKYESTQKAYKKAIYFLQMAFEELNDSTFVESTENIATSVNAGIVEGAWLIDEVEIKLEAKKIYENTIEKELSNLVFEQKNRRREKALNIEAANHTTAVVEPKSERTEDEYQPTDLKQKVQVESEPEPSLIVNSSDLGNSLTAVDYVLIEQKIENLIQRYEESLNNKDLQGIKILFAGHFTEGDEKTWKDFFDQIKKLRVKVLRENVEIGGRNADVILSVFIEYLSHDSPKAMRRGFVESWILEVQNGQLVFSSRKTSV